MTSRPAGAAILECRGHEEAGAGAGAGAAAGAAGAGAVPGHRARRSRQSRVRGGDVHRRAAPHRVVRAVAPGARRQRRQQRQHRRPAAHRDPARPDRLCRGRAMPRHHGALRRRQVVAYGRPRGKAEARHRLRRHPPQRRPSACQFCPHLGLRHAGRRPHRHPHRRRDARLLPRPPHAQAYPPARRRHHRRQHPAGTTPASGARARARARAESHPRQPAANARAPRATFSRDVHARRSSTCARWPMLA